MDFFNKEEVSAPTVEAAIAEAIKPVAVSVSSTANCTRDTRGENPCAVTNCENCN